MPVEQDAEHVIVGLADRRSRFGNPGIAEQIEVGGVALDHHGRRGVVEVVVGCVPALRGAAVWKRLHVGPGVRCDQRPQEVPFLLESFEPECEVDAQLRATVHQ